MTAVAPASTTTQTTQTTRTTWTTERLTPHFAAELHGLQLSQVAAAGSADLLYDELVRHKVLFVRGQDLDPDGQVALGRAIGELTASHPVMKGRDDHPEIWQLDGQDGGRSDVWHTDVTFMPRPPLGSILRAVRLPELGGSTSWVDLELAYASLSPGVRRLADELEAVHDGRAEFEERLRRDGGNDWDGERVRALAPVVHPVVRVHPDTGRRSLFVSPGFTTRIVGVSDAESRGLLDVFFAHLSKPEHMVRHRWREGDVVLWDNRSTAHYADFDYGDFPRLMHRITLRGDVPVGPRA